jgi:hypothetical protein
MLLRCESLDPPMSQLGSKCEILAVSRCLPLYPQNRTSLNAVGMSVSSKPDLMQCNKRYLTR